MTDDQFAHDLSDILKMNEPALAAPAANAPVLHGNKRQGIKEAVHYAAVTSGLDGKGLRLTTRVPPSCLAYAEEQALAGDPVVLWIVPDAAAWQRIWSPTRRDGPLQRRDRARAARLLRRLDEELAKLGRPLARPDADAVHAAAEELQEDATEDGGGDLSEAGERFMDEFHRLCNASPGCGLRMKVDPEERVLWVQAF